MKLTRLADDLSKIEAAYKRFKELEGYLYSNIRSLTDYGRAWRQGERIATANIESTVNQLVNQRGTSKNSLFQPLRKSNSKLASSERRSLAWDSLVSSI